MSISGSGCLEESAIVGALLQVVGGCHWWDDTCFLKLTCCISIDVGAVEAFLFSSCQPDSHDGAARGDVEASEATFDLKAWVSLVLGQEFLTVDDYDFVESYLASKGVHGGGFLFD